MEFRRRHSMVYATFKAFASLETGGVVGVLDGRQPIVRFLASKPDALGRSLNTPR